MSKERIKECKENKPIYPFLFINKFILLLLIAIELLAFISLILYLFNNNLLLNLIMLEVSLIIYAAYKLAN